MEAVFKNLTALGNILYFNDRHEEKDTWKEDRQKLYDKRILPLLTGKDATVFARPIDHFLWEYYKNLGLATILPENIFYARNYLNFSSLTKATLADRNLIKKLADKKFHYIIPYIESFDIQLLAEKIGANLLRPASLTENFNNKSFYRNIIEELEFPMIPGYTVSNFKEAEEKFEKLRKEGFERVVIKKERSISGFGVFISDSIEGLQKILQGDFSREKNFLLEGFIENIEISPNIQYFVGAEEIDFMVISDQILGKDLISYDGNQFPSMIKPGAFSEIRKLSLKICHYLQRKKCYGIIGIDFLVTKEGKIYSTEANVRFNGSTYPALIVSKLFGDKENIFWQFKTFHFQPLPFIKLVGSFGHLIDLKNKFGVFPVGVDLLETMGEGQFLIVGQTPEEVNYYVKKLEEFS